MGKITQALARPNRHRRLGIVVSVRCFVAFSTKREKVGVAVAMAAAVDVAVPVAVIVVVLAAMVGELVGSALCFAACCVMGREKHGDYHH